MRSTGYQFIDESGSFRMKNPQCSSYLYFPIANEAGMKSALTPTLGGDAKTGQNTFLLQPVSAEELHSLKATRNFWCRIDGEKTVSLTGAGAQDEADRLLEKTEENTVLEAGFMWHKLLRKLPQVNLESEILSFVPAGEDTVELMLVTVKNTGKEAVTIEPTAAIPFYARSADNIRDHRHVTSLLHRIETTREGVLVNPTLTFDERGHKKNQVSYYVLGAEGDGRKPAGFYPVTQEYIGEGGSFSMPEAVYCAKEPVREGFQTAGYEAMGAIAFRSIALAPQESHSWVVMLGIWEAAGKNTRSIQEIYESYGSYEKAMQAFSNTKTCWQERMNVAYQTGDAVFNQFMHWVSFQPMLRRIYGCSFLPHHDYGKGGRGWRDLWQDCLALLMMNPSGVRQMLLNHYGGVRIDGSNATIIGTKQGEFVADRNHITRVWMDHGLWPLMTTDFYVNQTGDIGLLLEEAPYFKDGQTGRGTRKDLDWREAEGSRQLNEAGKVYSGTVLEHILVQQLTAFYEVGEHNHMRLRGADWNDALDMAPERGESVAFTAAYAGNLRTLAGLVEALKKEKGIQELSIAKELEILLAAANGLYDSIERKTRLLQQYFDSCQHTVTGEKVLVSCNRMQEILTSMSEWITDHIRTTEWLEAEGQGWFNSYYDNHGKAVEGVVNGQVRMMLTGQVFTIMSGTASQEQTAQIIKAADRFLYQEAVGGYRLNTDFGEVKEDLGRMFGFAYGHKENGAVFSHMTTMYANALYQRGFAREGYRALAALYRQAVDFEVSRIYPGIPEYFNDKGRGMYHYLTGAASWYMMTVITQMYGIRGKLGNLEIAPMLLAEQFDKAGKAALKLRFADRALQIIYHNEKGLEYGSYRIQKLLLDGTELSVEPDKAVIIKKDILTQMSEHEEHKLDIVLMGME